MFISFPLHIFWAFLVAQMGKNPPAMQGTWILSLGWGHLLEKAMATHSSILAWRIPQTGSLVGYNLWDYKESDTTEQLSTYIFTQIWLYFTERSSQIINSFWNLAGYQLNQG